MPIQGPQAAGQVSEQQGPLGDRLGARQDGQNRFNWGCINPMPLYLTYHLALRAAFGTVEATLSGCNALTGNTDRKHNLAKITTCVAGSNAVLRFYDAVRCFQQGKPGPGFRDITCAIAEGIISACFIYASAKTNGDENLQGKNLQDEAEKLVYFALAASSVKLIIDLVFDCREINNQIRSLANQPIQNEVELGQIDHQDIAYIEQLQNDKRTLQNDKKTLQNDKKTLEETRDDLQAQLDVAQGQLVQMKEQKNRLLWQLDDAHGRVSKAEAERDRLNDQIAGHTVQPQPIINPKNSSGVRNRLATESTPPTQLEATTNKPRCFWVTNSEFLQKETSAINDLDSGIRYLKDGNVISAHQCLSRSLDLAVDLGRKALQALILRHLGKLHEHLAKSEKMHENLDKAMEYHSQSLVFNKELGRKESGFNNLISIGRLRSYFDKKDINVQNMALATYEQAFYLVKDNPLLSKEAKPDLDFINHYKQNNEPRQAIECYEKCLEQINFESENKMDYHFHRGAGYHLHHDFKNAIEHYSRALVISERLDLKEETASLLGHIGCAYQDCEQLGMAIKYYKSANIIDSTMSEDTIGQANNLSNLGTACKLKGDQTKDMNDYEQAKTYYQAALIINRRLEAIDGQASNHANLGLVYEKLFEYSDAESSYQTAKKLFGEDNRANILQDLIDALPKRAITESSAR